MANRRSASPGDVVRFEGKASLPDSLPTLPTEGAGKGAAAATAFFSDLSQTLGALADRAAEREGDIAGDAVGRAAGEALLGAPAGVLAKSSTDGPRLSGSLVSKIVGVESGGRASAKNPRSTATGAGQFIESTWEQFIRERHPELVARGDIQKFRNDRSLSEEAVLWYAAENEGALRSAGQPVNDGTLYLAHFLGPGGAVKALSADPATDAGSVLGADVVKANPFLAGKNVGWVVNWARGKMGATGEDVVPGAGYGETPAAADTTARRAPPPFALRRDGTIRGDAFDAAAMRAYVWRADEAIRRDLASVYETHKDDPKAFAEQVDKLKARYSSIGEDQKTREVLQQTFETRATTLALSVAARTEERRDAEEKAAAAGALDALERDIERQSYVLGANPAGDQTLSQQIQRGQQSVANAVEAGSISPEEGRKATRRLEETAVLSRVRGLFDSLEGVGVRKEFAVGLMEDWSSQKGPIATLEYAAVKSLAEEFLTEARRQEAEETAANVVKRAQLDDLIADDLSSVAVAGRGILVDGKPLNPTEISEVLGPQKFLGWQDARSLASDTWRATADFPQLSEAAIVERLAALEPEPGTPGYARSLKLHSDASAKAKTLLDQRSGDPAMAVDLAFPAVAALKEEFDPADPSSLRPLVNARLGAQASIGIPAEEQRPLSKSEARAIGVSMRSSPDAAEAWAMTLSTALGDRTDAVLSQVADDAPGIAYAADMVVKGGDPTSLRLLVGQQALERDPAYKAPPMDGVRSKMHAAASEAWGTAFFALPRTEAALRGNAEKLFVGLARMRGQAPEVESGAGRALYQEALQLAAGATFSGGRQLGGVTEINGIETLVPPGMPADDLAERLTGITDEQLASLPPIRSLTGIPIDAGDLAGAYFTAIGNGLYRVSLNPPTSPDPRYVAGEDGDFWTLDIGALSRAPRISGGGSISDVVAP